MNNEIRWCFDESECIFPELECKDCPYYKSMNEAGEINLPTCVYCGKSDKPVFRSNPNKGEGQLPNWKCEDCLSQPVPADVKQITDILSGGTNEQSSR